MKYLLLVLFLVLAYFIYKAHKRKLRASEERSHAAGTGGEDMVRCAQCGVHVPRSESLMSGRVFYCTPEHRRLHQKTD